MERHAHRAARHSSPGGAPFQFDGTLSWRERDSRKCEAVSAPIALSTLDFEPFYLAGFADQKGSRVAPGFVPPHLPPA
jgi:hypothetical protein